MIIGSRWWDVVSSFLGEDRSEVGEFRWKGLLRFCFFSGCSEFSSGGDLGYLLFKRRSFAKEAGSTSDDSMEGSVGVCTD